MDTFEGTFEPTSDDRRVIYACGMLLFELIKFKNIRTYYKISLI